jgi:hypothetical protein
MLMRVLVLAFAGRLPLVRVTGVPDCLPMV